MIKSLFSFPKKNRGAFTLLEIVIVIVIVAILIGLGIVFYLRVVSKSEESEAMVNLDAIRKAEITKRDEVGTFVNASNTSEVNEQLPLVEVEEKIFRYRVENATRDDFVAIAERIDQEKSEARSEPIRIAMYPDGGLGYSGGSGSSSSGGGGSSYGGGSGGGGGGGSGGGGGGGSGGGGGGSGGGSGGGDDDSGGGSSGGGAISSVFSNLTAIGNDGLVNLGWGSSAEGVLSYNIYRSSNNGVTYTLLQGGWPAYMTYYTDKSVMNNTGYYYQVEAVFEGNITSRSDAVLATPSSTSEYAEAMADAFVILSNSSNGSTIADKINEYNVPMGFGAGVDGAGAWYSPYFNTITISMSQYAMTENVHAAYLAHEGTHAWWDYDETQGAPLRVSANSIDQEYNAFVNGTRVWKEVKGSEADYNMDGWTSVIDQGEAYAKEYISMAYAGLPEY